MWRSLYRKSSSIAHSVSSLSSVSTAAGQGVSSRSMVAVTAAVAGSSAGASARVAVPFADMVARAFAGSSNNAVVPDVTTRAAKKKGQGADPSGAATSEDLAVVDVAAAEEETTTTDPKVLKTTVAKHVDYARKEIAKLRGGQASPSMLDHVKVEAYGELQGLSGLAQVALKSPQLLVINPFDAALAGPIADAVRNAGLNLNPAVDGNIVRVPIPKTSKETKDASLKLLSKIAEEGKARVRRTRQATLDKLKKLEGVSSDQLFKDMKEVQNIVNAATEEVTKLAEKKKQEIETS